MKAAAAISNHTLALVRQPEGAALSLHAEISPVAVYLAGCAPSSRRAHLTNLARVARLFATPPSVFRWEELRFSHVEMIRARLQGEGFAPATINVTLCALRGVARRAWQLGLTSVEDYQRLRDVRGVRGTHVGRGRALAPEEIAALLAACAVDETAAGERDAALIALLAGAGLRRSEAAAADITDYAPAARALKVHGKGERERYVYFAEGGASRLLDAWLARRGTSAGALLCPVTKAGDILLRRMSAHGIYFAIQKRAREAGVARFAPHDLRRTFASRLLERTADIASVQALLGHASIETTVLYDRRGETAKRLAASLLDFDFRKPRRKRKPRKSRHKRRHSS